MGISTETKLTIIVTLTVVAFWMWFTRPGEKTVFSQALPLGQIESPKSLGTLQCKTDCQYVLQIRAWDIPVANHSWKAKVQISIGDEVFTGSPATNMDRETGGNGESYWTRLTIGAYFPAAQGPVDVILQQGTFDSARDYQLHFSIVEK